MAQTAAQVDAELTAVRERYIAADLDGDMPLAATLYGLLDDLLDVRLHLPAQRPA